MIRVHHRPLILEIGSARVSVTIPGVLAVGLILLFFVISTNNSIYLMRKLVPDENWHILVSQLSAATWGTPSDTPETYFLGVLSHKPFLFHWINGRLLNLLNLIFPEPGNYKVLVMLRLTGVFYSTLAVIYCYRLSKEIIRNPWWQLVPLFLLICTLMFVLHSSGVNYDSLTNLCAFAGIYYFVKVLKGEAYYRNSLLWMVWVLTGTLVKITVLPLLAIMVIVWAVYTVQNRRQIDYRIPKDWKVKGLLAVLVVLLGLNFMIYGVNLIKFRAVIPSCAMVLSESECEQNALYRRDKNAEDNLSVAQMFNGNAPDPFTWFDTWWFPWNLRMIYGFAGDKWYTPSDMVITLYRWWFLGMVLLIARYWKKPPLPVLGLAVIVAFYILALLQTNLTAELKNGFKHLGIQGRYTFPVLGGLYILFAYHAEKVQNRLAAGVIALTTFALFFFNSPVWVLTVPTDIVYPSKPIQPELASVPLASGLVVHQDMKSECTGDLTGINVFFFTEQSSSASQVKLVLTDLDRQQVIAEQVAESSPGDDGQWLSFPLNSLKNTKGRNLRFSLTAEGLPVDQPLRIWNTTTNVYLFGDAIINGEATNNDLVFWYSCRQPALKDWFNK